MWELYTKINGKTGEKQKFSDFKEGKKAFRKAVKQAFDENPDLLEHFIAQIDAYCDKYFPVKKRAKKPVPSSFNSLKNVLRNYATNAAYNINPDVFFVTSYQDKNIEIRWCDLYEVDGQISLSATITKKNKDKSKKKGQLLIFPDIRIPLRFEADEFGECFSITDRPDGVTSLLPNTFSIYVRLEPEDNSEYFDEDDYDDDDDDECDDDYDDDEDEYDDEYDEDEDEDDEEVYTPPVRSSNYTYSTPSKPKKDDELTYMERVELRSAQKSYERAAAQRARFTDPRTAKYHEAAEKQAYAEYMRVLAKYAGKK